MRFKFAFLLIVLLTKGYGQSKEQINLPKGGEEFSFYGTIEFFITKNQEVFNNDRKFNFYDDISNYIMNESGLPLEKRVLIYADKKVKYSFIDKIKQEVALVERVLFLMTDTIGETKKGYLIYLNSYLNKRKDWVSILTLEQDLKNETFNVMVPPPPLPPSSMWYHDFEDIIYSGKKEDIREVLKERTYNILKVSLNNTLIHKGKIIDSNNLKKILKETDVVFLKFDNDILYEDYIHAVQEINRVLKQTEKLKESGTSVIEISFQLEALYMDLGIELN